VFRNIEACKEITKITKSSYGPNGKSSFVKNECNFLDHCSMKKIQSEHVLIS
jgi:hypothetical protein